MTKRLVEDRVRLGGEDIFEGKIDFVIDYLFSFLEEHGEEAFIVEDGGWDNTEYFLVFTREETDREATKRIREQKKKKEKAKKEKAEREERERKEYERLKKKFGDT